MSDKYYGILAVSKLTEMCTTRKTVAEFPPYSNEPSWDGFIMYQPFDDTKKGLKKIHVQIKGRKDDGNNKFSVERLDLENYKTNGGILFLVTKFKSDNEFRHLYKLMMPEDIDKYLKTNSSQNITISLKQLFNKDKIIEICEAYSLKSNDIYDRAMPINYMPQQGELKRIQTIVNDVVVDGLCLSNENVYVSLETNQGKYYADNVKLEEFKSNQKYKVSIDGIVYFHSALIEKAHSIIKLTFNSCLNVSLYNNAFNIDFNSLGMFPDVLNALRFLVNIKNDTFLFGDCEIKLDNISSINDNLKLSEHYENLSNLKKILLEESKNLDFKLESLTKEEQMYYSRKIDYINYSKFDIRERMPRLYYNGFVSEFDELYEKNIDLIENSEDYFYIRCIKLLENNERKKVYKLLKDFDWDSTKEIGILEIQIDLYYEFKDYYKTIECCEKYITAKGYNVEILNIQSVAYMQIGELEKAKDKLIYAIDKYPASSNLHYNLAVYYHVVGNFDLSLKEVDEAEKLEHDDKYLVLKKALLKLVKN